MTQESNQARGNDTRLDPAEFAFALLACVTATLGLVRVGQSALPALVWQ